MDHHLLRRLSFGVFISSVIIPFSVIVADEHERRLHRNLFTHYSAYERPVLNHSDAVRVKLQLVLNQLVDVDEKNQTLQLNVWLKYEWFAHNLVWDPMENGGIDHLSLPYGMLWKPDILLYNSVGSDFDTTYHVNYILYSSGHVNWIPPAVVRSSCIMDVTWFPFDDQRCELKFGSWSYGSKKLNLNYSEPAWDMSEYIRNGEWDIIKSAIIRTEKPYDCCRGDYVDLRFVLHLRRRALYYGFNKIVPSLLISVTAVLSFALPAESIEKITLEITIFLSMYLFLDILAAVTPPTDNLPFLGIVFSSIMILVTISVVINIMTLNLHHRSPQKCVMSSTFRNIFLRWLPPLVLMKPRTRSIRRTRAYRRKATRTTQSQSANGSTAARRPLTENGHSSAHRCSRDHGLLKPSDAVNAAPLFPYEYEAVVKTVLSLEFERTHREVRLIARELKRKDDVYIRAIRDWQYAARVVDRACLIVLSALVAIAFFVVAQSAYRQMR